MNVTGTCTTMGAKSENRTVAQRYVTAVRPCDGSRDCEAEAIAPSLSAARCFQPVEGFENALELVVGNSGPFINDADASEYLEGRTLSVQAR